MDGGLMYGVGKAWADALRSFCGGRLASTNETCDKYKLGGNKAVTITSNEEEGTNYSTEYPAFNDVRLPMANPPPPRDHYIKEVKRFFKLGNPRGNENPFLLTFGVLWFRYHNWWARKLEQEHSSWSDEKLFNEARIRTIATHQKIVAYDWLPSWIGEDENGTTYGLPDYKGYNPNVNPQIAHIFQSAAMRYGHTLVPPGVYRRNQNCNFRNTSILTGTAHKAALRTCNTYWNPQEAVLESGVEELMMGMASQITEREDNIITPDLRGFVFGTLDFSRRDLMAVNIQRGRDHGLPDYNTARKFLQLKPREKWEDINQDLCQGDINSEGCSAIRRLRDVYKNNINNLDIWAAGLLETTPRGPGELFRTVILDQFQRIRDGDRFWFENYEYNGLFTKEEVEDIWNTGIYDVVIRTTGLPHNAIQKDPFRFNPNDHRCKQPAQINGSVESIVEECTPMETYDYFTGSDVPFVLTFLAAGVWLLGCIGLLYLLAKIHIRKTSSIKALSRQRSRKSSESSIITAQEWVGKKEGNRNIKIKFDSNKKAVQVNSERNRPLRTVDLSHAQDVTFQISTDKQMKVMLLRVDKEYDLVLRFDSMVERGDFIDKLERFLGDTGLGRNVQTIQEAHILEGAVTKAKRQSLLEKFFRVTFAHAFDIKNEHVDPKTLDANEAKDIVNCELTKIEFAEALSMKPSSVFVENMFKLVDKDMNGYISFREFLDMIVIFSKGSAEDRMKLLFDMYDITSAGCLTKKEFNVMIKSLMELANTSVEESQINQVVDNMMKSAGLADKSQITFEDFQRLLRGHEDILQYAQLNWQATGVDVPQQKPTGARNTVLRENAPTRARKTIVRAFSVENDGSRSKRMSSTPGFKVETTKQKAPKTKTQKRYTAVLRYFENYRFHIFWSVLYSLVCIGIFVERAYYYSIEREHAGLRRIAGFGVTVTRGAASGMMFTFACLLVTMCRNLITFLRETVAHRFIPFDSAITFHKFIAAWALFFTAMHIIGHGINFYHISTQLPGDVTCYFRDFFRATHQLPTFTYWCWNTITGFTGVLLTLLVILMYVFATQYSRRHCFQAFWITHNMFYLLYILMVMHGAGRLVQPGFTHYFILGPLILFALDKLVSVSRNKVEIAVLKAEALPSDITFLEFKKPTSFEYKSGQWVRIACITMGENEYHPFTLTSAPHEDTLSLHIRAVGPWTMNLRHTYDPSVLKEHAFPKLYLDGPFGEGHQDWYKFDVSVLVGGGIGVTPFASILKDLVHRSAIGAKFTCKKIYFLWVTRTQKHFEWLTDIIREVEEKDRNGLVSVHIFITQFFHKFDLRTTMLYICERHFQKISERSLFTGLRSITHFGRPQFENFLDSLQEEHPDVGKIGVFSCGPPAMTRNVETACTNLNKYDGAAFIHHYENF
ncbi:dual oxidase 2-like isoform X2 [Lingula anatina]|nr:dual oxidase 2-like isoform X2 [Lingula anatina]|eukprot:XP_013378732.1 dual oxidase 2-like isoform X2 [Lingula anatina]